MPRDLGALTLIVMVGLVLARLVLMRRQGVRAMHFGRVDRGDLVIPPFALVYVYLVLAGAFGWPAPGKPLFASPFAAWLGVGLCAIGPALFVSSMVSFGRSFRLGIDATAPDRLVTTGVFALSRNPIYVALALVLVAELLVNPTWLLLLYLLAGMALFHRQVLREEAFMQVQYGLAYVDYCRNVRRYL